MAKLLQALLTLLLVVSWTSAAPSPSPVAVAGPDCGFNCCKQDCCKGFLGAVLCTIEIVLGFLLGIVLAVVSIILSLLGPATDTTTLLGALNGVNTLEGFLGSLPVVLKLLNLFNVPTAILG